MPPPLQLVAGPLPLRHELPLPGIEGGVRRVRVCGRGGGDAGGCIYLFAREEAVGDEIFNTTIMAQSQHLHCNSHSSDRVIIIQSNPFSG